MQIAISELQAGDESDDYLIELMGMKEDFPEESMAAYGKIYFRYWDVMLVIATNVTKDESDAEDLLSDTFNMVYKRAATFNKGKVHNSENIRLSIQKWMTVIMQRIFYDHYLDDAYKKPSDNENPEDSFIIDNKSIRKHLSDDYNDFIENLEQAERFEIEPDKGQNESENLARVKESVNKLSERDKDIVLTVYNYHVPGKKTPSEVLDDLEKRWETTRQNIRKILEKFRKAIKEDLQFHLSNRK